MLGLAAPAGEPAIARARRSLIDELAARLEEGSGLRPDDAEPLPACAEVSIVDAALNLVADRVAAGEGESLPELAPELGAMLGALIGFEVGTGQ
jgi:hypothetical protein